MRQYKYELILTTYKICKNTDHFWRNQKNENDPIQVTKMPPKKKKGRSPKKRKMPAWLKKPKSKE